MRRGSLLAIIAVASAREKPTSRAARRARKAWLNGTKPPTLNMGVSCRYMLSRQRYAEWLPTAINTTGCTTFSRKRGTGAGHGSRGHG